MKRYLLSLLLISTTVLVARSQVATQSVRGRITDGESGYPVYAAIMQVVPDPAVPETNGLRAETDDDGRFTLNAVPIGRRTLTVSAMGYKPLTTAPLVLVAGKELVVELQLQPVVSELAEVQVKAGSADKERVNNEMAVLSARAFDSELAGRFAGSRADPARMATNFAGVSGANDGRNDIIIRGNSPAGLLWRLEGVDIPSPNHFSSFGSTGGPVGMLNNNTLAKSDFITSAFPAMYGNAMSGVFDLSMRNGNDQRHEFLGQIGFNGFEFGAEGPIDKATHSSYLVNYRYSTLQAFKELGLQFGTGDAIPKYQDLSFKINVPTKKAGHFTLFGFGGTSNIDLLGSETDFSKKNDNDLYGTDTQDIYNNNASGMVGLSHTWFFNERTSYRITLSAGHQEDHTTVDSLTWSNGVGSEIRLLDTDPVFSTKNHQNTLNAHLYVRSKLDARNTVQVGVVAAQYEGHFFRRYFRSTVNRWDTLGDGGGTYALLQAYGTWKHFFSEKVFGTIGVHGQYHALSNDRSLEPRVGLSWQPSDRSTWSVAYGLHAQTQLTPVYFVTTPDGRPTTNRDLGFTRGQHAVIGHTQRFGGAWSLKMEAYFQSLFDVPVERVPSTFSMLNSGNDFAPPDDDGLANKGIGRNYGLEITAERAFEKGLYALFTASLFKSEYQGSDLVWRNTVYDGNYVFNALAGREWKVGKRNNTLAVDLKSTWAGGRRFTPIDLDASRAAGSEVRIEDRAYTEKYPDYFRTDLKIMYRKQGKKVTQEIGIDLQNLTGQKNIYTRRYDSRAEKLVTEYQIGFFPIPQYRILF